MLRKNKGKNNTAVNFNLPPQIFLNSSHPSPLRILNFFRQLMEDLMLKAFKWTPETRFPGLALPRKAGPSAGKPGEAQGGGQGTEEGSSISERGRGTTV